MFPCYGYDENHENWHYPKTEKFPLGSKATQYLNELQKLIIIYKKSNPTHI
jgi:hypothetical protein